MHLHRYPPTSLVPRLGGTRPTALAADGSLPQITGDLPPGGFSAWAPPDLTVSPSAAAAAAAGGHGSHDPTLCTSGEGRRSPGRRAGTKKQALRLVATAGGPGTIWFCDGLHRLTACLPGVTVLIRFAGVTLLAVATSYSNVSQPGCLVNPTRTDNPGYSPHFDALRFPGLDMAEPAAAMNNRAFGASGRAAGPDTLMHRFV